MATPARVYALVAAVFLAGVGAVFLVRELAFERGFGSGRALLLLTVLQALNCAASLRLQRKETERFDLDEAVFVAALLILEPLGTLVVFGVGTPVGILLLRDRPLKAVFNTGQMVVGAAAGLGVAHLIAPFQHEAALADLLAAVVGALAFGALNGMAMAGILTVAESLRFKEAVLQGLKPRSVQWACSVAVGLLAGLGGSAYEWAPLIALPPIAVVHVVIAEHVRARRDRERIDGLFQTAVQAHSSVRTEDVQDALSQSAGRLLRCEAAWVAARPPRDDEWGARLTVDGTTQWWLVVQSGEGDGLDDEDQRLLEAISAVGSSALDNARLVEEIRRQALHDPLTGLANQLLFEDRVAQTITHARRARERFAVFVVNVDAFKKVNDSLGHSLGNDLLVQVGERLAASVREIDTVARLGSDHFTLLLPGVGTPDTAAVMAEKVLAAIRRPFDLGDHELFMTASAGIAFFPEDGVQPDHLLRNADSAMHRAKEIGRDGYQAYATGMNELAHLRLARESELHNAVAREELRVRYQPQIDLRNGRMVGVEALVRWEHPVLGLIGPHEFVPLAEESGLIVDVDAWVLGEACRQAQQWTEEGLPPIRMAVNLSGRHFHSDRIVDTIRSVLMRTGLDPTRLELEVTESVAVREADDPVSLLERIHELGVQIAIDDFGTGYSVLGRLQRFPVDRVKIDRSFVSEIESADSEAPIVSAMIAMARSLRLEVVAEGVETLEQQTFLRNRGCDQAQGFLFSHPVEPGEIGRLLRTPSVGFSVGV